MSLFEKVKEYFKELFKSEDEKDTERQRLAKQSEQIRNLNLMRAYQVQMKTMHPYLNRTQLETLGLLYIYELEVDPEPTLTEFHSKITNISTGALFNRLKGLKKRGVINMVQGKRYTTILEKKEYGK